MSFKSRVIRTMLQETDASPIPGIKFVRKSDGVWVLIEDGWRLVEEYERGLPSDVLKYDVLGNLYYVRKIEERSPMSDFDSMVQLLDLSWQLRSEIVPCLVGPPGIGKTAAVMQHARDHGCGKVVKIVASRCVPSETVGMTMPDHKNRSMDIYNSMQLSSLEDGDILFLDELLEAEQYVLSTLLTVIESREMADGTPLPDIQIVAATNDTIPPEQLKGNIRQRFMFQRFNVDRNGTAEYIKQRTGMELQRDVLSMLCDKGSDYNFLTPRSLTKLCMWMDSVDKSQVSDLANLINVMWSCQIGTKIMHARLERDSSAPSPEQQFREAVARIVPEVVSEYHFDNMSLSDMYEVLTNLPEWAEIANKLSKMDIKERTEESEVDVQF